MGGFDWVEGSGRLLIQVCSQRRLECVPLRWSSGWKMEVEEAIAFPGAHGEEIVRCIYIDDKARGIQGLSSIPQSLKLMIIDKHCFHGWRRWIGEGVEDW